MIDDFAVEIYQFSISSRRPMPLVLLHWKMLCAIMLTVSAKTLQMRKQIAPAKERVARNIVLSLPLVAMLPQLTVDVCPWHTQLFPPHVLVQLLSGLHSRGLCSGSNMACCSGSGA